MAHRTTLLALAVLGLAHSAAAAPRPRARTLTILYIADLGGTLEPCGCSQDQRGGLPRLATALARVRREAPGAVLVAGGDLLFEGPLDPERREADVVKARATAAALRAMGLAASVEGERDLEAGEPFARQLKLPFTTSRRLGDLGFGLLGKVPAAPFRVAVVHQRGTRGALPHAEEARAQGVDLILASHRDPLNDDDVDRAILDAPVPVVQVRGRGQSVARIDVRLAGDPRRGFAVLQGPAQRAEEIDLAEERARDYRRRQAAAEAGGRGELARALSAKAAELEARARTLRAVPLPAPPGDRPSLTVSFIPVTSDLPEDPAVRRLLARAYGEMARLNLASARARGRPCPDPARDQPTYVGVERAPPGGNSACKECHPAAFAQWRTTPHARAYATLVHSPSGPRQYDLECVGCHVTGWQAPGGACSVAAVAGREDVQCESCHGPASLHAVDPPGHIRRDPGEEVCRACHTPDHSTAFEMSAYRKRILGPGHGTGN